jgi:hypothetical protein
VWKRRPNLPRKVIGEPFSLKCEENRRWKNDPEVPLINDTRDAGSERLTAKS